jgi:hypothetical protein
MLQRLPSHLNGHKLDHRQQYLYCCASIRCCGDVLVCDCYIVTVLINLLIWLSLHSNGSTRYNINRNGNEEVCFTATSDRHVYDNSIAVRANAHFFLGVIKQDGKLIVRPLISWNQLCSGQKIGKRTHPLFEQFLIAEPKEFIPIATKGCHWTYPESFLLRMVLFPGIKRRVIHWKSTDFSEENIAYIFRAEE